MSVTTREPHCVLEAWDTGRKAWVAMPSQYASIAAATAAATERGIYRVVLVERSQKLPLDIFAIVCPLADHGS